jgi:hypothetical protein
VPEQPEQPFRGVEYPSIERYPPPPDPYAPVEYPGDYSPLPPPVYPQPAAGYPPPYPSYPPPYPGYPPAPYGPYWAGKPPGTNGKAIAALVTAIAGLLFCGLPSIAGVILGVIAMRETKSTGQDGYGIALAGTIIGALAVVFFVLYIALMVIIAASGWQAV